MPLPLIWIAAAGVGYLAGKLGDYGAKKIQQQSWQIEGEITRVRQNMEKERDSMLQRSKALLQEKKAVLDTKLKWPLISYIDQLSSLREILPPPELARKLTEIPPFNFDYSDKTKIGDSGTALSKMTDNEISRHTVIMNRMYGTNAGLATFGFANASRGMQRAMDASQYRASVRNLNAEAQMSKNSFLAALGEDEKTLQSLVTTLFFCIQEQYEAVHTLAQSGRSWEDLCDREQLIFENYYYPVVKFETLCQLEAFGMLKENQE